MTDNAQSARFVVQREEYPDWFAGWNNQNLPCWTSEYGDAKFVRFDELVATLTRLADQKPIAALYLPNDKVERRAPSTFAPTPGSALCPICKENPQPADRSTCHECEQELNANQECED